MKKILLFLLFPLLVLFQPAGAQSVDIVTAGNRSVNRDLWNVCTVDISYSGASDRPKMVDINNPLYVSGVASLGFSGWSYPGVSTADGYRWIIGETRVYDGSGHGYNSTLCEYLGCVYVPKDFNTDFASWAKNIGGNVCIIANVQSASWEELKFAISLTAAKTVLLGAEQNLQSNAFWFPDGLSYVTRANYLYDSIQKCFPWVQVIAGAPPVYKETRRNYDFEKALKGCRVPMFSQYAWDIDLVGLISRDWAANLVTVNYALDVTFPAWVVSLEKKYPGKSFALMQWGLKNQSGYESGLRGTTLGFMWLAKEMICFVNYDASIKRADLMSLDQYVGSDGSPENEYYTIQKIGDWFGAVDSVCVVTFPGVSGVRGVVGVRGKNYSLLLVNDNSLPTVFEKINVDGKGKNKKAVSVSSVYGASLSSGSVSFSESQSTGGFTLPGYSVSLVEF